MRIRTTLAALALTAAGFIGAVGTAAAADNPFDNIDLSTNYGPLNIQLCQGNCSNAPEQD
ncbi:hypothetical protein ACWCQE_41925 [Streptomyces sp. NPDC002409]